MIDELVRLSTCAVSCDEVHGSGHLVTSSLVLTARHCVLSAIDGEAEIRLTFPAVDPQQNPIGVVATVVADDADLDVCILEVPTTRDRKVLPVRPSLPREGAPWTSFGYPDQKSAIGHRLVGTVAQVLGKPVEKLDIDLVVDESTTLSKYEGLSGSALVIGGFCCGVIRLRLGKNSLAAISAKRLSHLFEAAGLQLTPVSPRADSLQLAERDEFQQAIEDRILKLRQGYLFLEGAPGLGKTTFCSYFTPRSEKLLAVGAYCTLELSKGSNVVVRSQPEFLQDWLVTRIASLLGGKLPRSGAKPYQQLVKETGEFFLALSQYCESNDQIAIVLIDGLNEVLDLAGETLQKTIGVLPPSLPPSVVVVLSAPNYSQIAPSLSGRVESGNVCSLPPLSPESSFGFVAARLEGEQLDPEVCRSVCEKANGNPLYLNYLVEYVRSSGTDVDLRDFPTLQGPIEDYYERIWAHLLSDQDSVHLLSLIARLRGGLDAGSFLKLLTDGEKASYVATQTRLRHLMNPGEDITLYHASFNAFVVAKTATAESTLQSRIGVFCAENPEIEYCWQNRIHHLLSGSPDDLVAAIQTCDQCWVDGYIHRGGNPDVLLHELGRVTDAALRFGTPAEAIRVLLLASRCSFRIDTLFAQSTLELATALISIGRPQDGLRYAIRYNTLLLDNREAFQLADLLIAHDHIDEAQDVLELVGERCVRAFLTGSLRADHFIEFTVDQQVAALFAGTETGTSTEYLRRIQGRALNVIRDNTDENQSKSALPVVRRICSVPSVHLFTFHHEYGSNQQLRDRLGDTQIADQEMLEGRVELLLSYMDAVESYRLLKREAPVDALVKDIAELVAAGMQVDPIQKVYVADACMRLGASSQFVATLLGENFERPTAFGLRKENGVDADKREAYRQGLRWRAVGYLDLDAAPPPMNRFQPTNWLAGIESLFSRLFFFEGRARRALADDNDELLVEAKDGLFALLSGMDWTLESRAQWDRSYAIPETTVSFWHELAAEVVFDCFCNEHGAYLEQLENRLAQQFGLYTEGFRDAVFNVVEYWSRSNDLTVGTRQSLFRMTSALHAHVIGGVDNRHERIPELLRLMFLFGRLGAQEKAESVYEDVLNSSMGPTWYKEDQFDLLPTTIKYLDDATDLLSRMPRVAGYLERASGEMTFQRYVRYSKADLIGALAAVDHVPTALEYFKRESSPDLLGLRTDLESGVVDRLSALAGGRHPGASLDEQDAILRFVTAAGDKIDWRLRWALLDVFLCGDSRHTGEQGRVYAQVVNGLEESTFEEAKKLLAGVLRNGLPSDQGGAFASAFLAELNEDREAIFAQSVQVDGVENEDPPAAFAPPSGSSPSGENVSRDDVFMPGLLGRQAAVDEAEEQLEEARSEFNLGNRGRCRDICIDILKTVQEGEWCIWDSPTRSSEIAHALLERVCSTPDELLSSYAPLIEAERHTTRWAIAEHLIPGLIQSSPPDVGMAILDNVVGHISAIVGNAKSAILDFEFLGEAPSLDNDTAVFELMVWLVDHPLWFRRERAAEVLLRLITSDNTYLSKAAESAFGVTSGLGPDVLCGAIDYRSERDPVGTWAVIEEAVDVSTLSTCSHLGRLACLRRVALRDGSTGAMQIADAVEKRSVGKPSPISEKDLELPAWADCVAEDWEDLLQLGIDEQKLLVETRETLQKSCEPFGIEQAMHLEQLLSQSFQSPPNWPLSRWEGRVRYSLNSAILSVISASQFSTAAEILSVCNPEAPCSSLEPPLHPSLTEREARSPRTSDYLKKTRHGEDVVLHYSDLSTLPDGTPVDIEMLAVLVPADLKKRGFFLPTTEAEFLSRRRPDGEANKDALNETCWRVSPRFAFFGTYTPAVPLTHIVESSPADLSDFERRAWSSGRSSLYQYRGRPDREGCSLSIRADRLGLPSGTKLAWIVRTSRHSAIMFDQEGNRLF